MCKAISCTYTVDFIALISQFCPTSPARPPRAPERRRDGEDKEEEDVFFIVAVLPGLQGGGHQRQGGAEATRLRAARHGRGVPVRGLQLPDAEQNRLHQARRRLSGDGRSQQVPVSALRQSFQEQGRTQPPREAARWRTGSAQGEHRDIYPT